MIDLFFNIGLFIIIATIFALITRALKQPLIPGYIVAGLILGPVLKIIPHTEEISALADIGVAFLLFLVGMELNFSKLKQLGHVILIGGTIQNVVMLAIGYFASNKLLGLGPVSSAYFACIATFSSTMVVIKILVDKGRIDTLHGKMIIGFLLVEDFFALLVLSSLNLVANFNVIYFIVVIAKLVLLLGVSFLINKFIVLPVFNQSSKSQEISFLVALSSAFFFAFLFQFFGKSIVMVLQVFRIYLPLEIVSILSHGVSIAIGAFIAGIGIGLSHFSYNVVGKISSLRDFFATLFFVSLGLGFSVSHLDGIVIPTLVLLLLIVFIKPIVVFINVFLWGYTKKTSFETAIHLTQISEFALIILALGVSNQAISQQIYSSVVVVALISLTTSAYMIKYSDQLFNLYVPLLRIFDKMPRRKEILEYLPKNPRKEVLLIGYNRIGYSIFHTLIKLKKDFLIVDYNPEIIKTLMHHQIHCIYGDILNPHIAERVKMDKAKVIICTVPDLETNRYVLRKTKHTNRKGIVILTAYSVEESLELYDEGADYVIIPHLLGGHHMSVLIEKFDRNLNHLIKTKMSHIEELQKHVEMHKGNHKTLHKHLTDLRNKAEKRNRKVRKGNKRKKH